MKSPLYDSYDYVASKLRFLEGDYSEYEKTLRELEKLWKHTTELEEKLHRRNMLANNRAKEIKELKKQLSEREWRI